MRRSKPTRMKPGAPHESLTRSHSMPDPKALTRRQVLQTASLLGVSTATLSLASSGASAAGLTISAESGLTTGKPKPLKYEEIPGLLTKEQVAPHFQAHYGGALKRFVAIEQQLDQLIKGKE